MKKFPNFSIVQREPALDNALRPKSLSEFIGQERIKERLALIINAAKKKRGSHRPYSFCRTSRLRKNYPCFDNSRRTKYSD